MICLLYPPLPSQKPGFLCDRKNTVRLVSPQQEMKVWTKTGPLKTAPSGTDLQHHSLSPLLATQKVS